VDAGCSAGARATTILGMNKKLAKTAASQGRVFTRRQALDAGLTPAQVRVLIAREWLVLLRGVYAERALADSLSPEARHVLDAAAAVVASRLGPVASHRTGALAHGLPLLGGLPELPQLTRTPRSSDDTSRTPGLHVATLLATDLTSVGGMPVTTLPRTAVDIARTEPVRAGVVFADAVLRRLVPQEELLAVAQAHRSWPGGPRAVRVAAFADGRAETPLESLTRLAYRQERLPTPESQVEVWRDGRFVALVDFLFRDQRTVGEADGMGKYDQPGALRAEKRREEDLRRCGLEVVRNIWDEAWQPTGRAELAQRMRDAFGYAKDRPLAPGVTFRVPPLAELVRREQARAGRAA
jgi:very-short-patch-repair endonuclease